MYSSNKTVSSFINVAWMLKLHEKGLVQTAAKCRQVAHTCDTEADGLVQRCCYKQLHVLHLMQNLQEARIIYNLSWTAWIANVYCICRITTKWNGVFHKFSVISQLKQSQNICNVFIWTFFLIIIIFCCQAPEIFVNYLRMRVSG